MGLLRFFGKNALNFGIFFLVVILIPELPPQTTFPFKEIDTTTTKELKGALEPNHHLDGAERLLDARVYGPECLISRKNEIYTGIHGGEIIKLTASHVTHVAKLGQPCEDIFEEARCGRPLGLAFDTLGNNLIVADAYYGLWSVDLNTGKKSILVSPGQVLSGKKLHRKAMIFNSVVVDSAGDIYWTDSSSDFLLQDIVYTTFANPSGRLFKYDRVKQESHVLMDELFFANGVALSPNEDFIVVAETGAMRLMKYYLKGVKAGKSEVFVEGLPGMPDNLTPDVDGIWVPLVMTVDSQHPSVFTIFARFPKIRLFLSRLLYLFELPFKWLNDFYPSKMAERFIHFIGHGESVMILRAKRSTIVRIDWSGNIVGSLHGFDTSVGAVSHVLEFGEYLYLGSPYNRYLARVKSPKVSKQPGVKIRNVRFDGGIELAGKPSMAAPPPKATPTTTERAEAASTKASTMRPSAATAATTAAPPSMPRRSDHATTVKTATIPKVVGSSTARPARVVEVETPPTTPRPRTASVRPVTTAKPLAPPQPVTSTRAPTTAAERSPEQPMHSPRPSAATPAAAARETPPKPAPAASSRSSPQREPAPVEENIVDDVVQPRAEKLRVINRMGEHVEL